jgi:hypothetical protein
MAGGFSIDISHNIKDVQKQLTRLQRKQIPFAAAKALTDTAWDAQRAVTRQIPQKLDRPTKFTRGAIGVKRATKRKLISEVFVKPVQAEYLKWQIDGGVRRISGVGTGVPTKNKKLNKFGNIPGRKSGLIKGKNQFIATMRGVTGVWQRFGGKRNPQVKLIVAFEKTVRYEKRLLFYKIVLSVVNSKFAKNFDKSIRLALATMR